jgi:LacI family transcriptional regulator
VKEFGGEKVTLADVARLSGVSRATASRAMNGRSGVRDDVRERVTRIADHLDFRPNRAAKILASGRSSVVGLVIPSTELRIDPYGASMTHAVARATAERDLGLMLYLAADEPGAGVRHILRDGLIDGLLISSVAIGAPWVDELIAAPLPTGLIGTHPTRDDIVGVDVENMESSAAAVQHLFDRGCLRVGIITGPLDRGDAVDRLNGYRAAHHRALRPIDETLIVNGAFTRPSGVDAATQLFERGVDGIFACNDEMAIGALWAGARLGVEIPDDVAIVGFDGTGLDEHIEPTLTTIVQPFDAIALAAVDELLDQIEGRSAPRRVLITPELVEGGSSARTHAIHR